MSRPRFMLAIAFVVTALSASAPAPSAAAEPAACALTTDQATPARPSPGTACWTDVEPYPFGVDGDPVDTTVRGCATLVTPPAPGTGDSLACFLQVTSLAFRAPNRGLAATRSAVDTSPGPFGVWLYNGSRWYPDPTFPGQRTCSGDTVLWAGKLDYWLVGAKGFGSLCRFDGASFTWQSLPVPRDTMVQLLPQDLLTGYPGDLTLNGGNVGIASGACFAWNDCWFFGSFGSILRWDGARLTDASPDRFAQPWLRNPFAAAVARVDASGKPFAVAVSRTGERDHNAQVQPRPGPAPPRQMYASSGGAFSAVDFVAPTAPQPADPFRTDLVAVDLDGRRRGWIAANPSARSERAPVFTAEPAPLLAVSPGGRDPACAGPPADRFMHRAFALRTVRTYQWSAIAVLPGGDALAAGAMQPGVVGTGNNDGTREPVLVRAACDGTVTETRFRRPDPSVIANPPLVPANRGGTITSVAVTASNDAWAGTTSGGVTGATQRPRLYHLTDTAPPQADRGDDVEARPIELVVEAPDFVEEPVPQDPPALVEDPETITTEEKPRQLPRPLPSIYAVRPLKPRAIKRGRDRGRFVLWITFKLRRPVTVGLRGLYRNRIVSSSGLKRFAGTRGRLALTLDRRRWPTKLRLYYPSATATPSVETALSAAPGPRR